MSPKDKDALRNIAARLTVQATPAQSAAAAEALRTWSAPQGRAEQLARGPQPWSWKELLAQVTDGAMPATTDSQASEKCLIHGERKWFCAWAYLARGARGSTGSSGWLRGRRQWWQWQSRRRCIRGR